MKAELVSKIFILVFCSLFFVSAISAQEKPQAVYVGEAEASDKDLSAFEAMVERLVFRLLSEPATTYGVIGIYEKGELGDRVKSILFRYPQLKNKIFYGLGEKSFRFRPSFPVAFWILPKDAEFPDLGCNMPICECPTLSVTGFESFASQTVYPTFTAKTEGGEDTDKITYVWKVSAGKIIRGQGMPTIEVDAEGANEIIATVEIGGVCEECDRIKSFTTKIQ